MDGTFQLAQVSAAQFALIGAVAFAASILGGLTGYGTGLVLPIFLAPAVGVANVIPVMAVGMVFNNGSRVIAFWRDIRWREVSLVLGAGLPACVAGAWGYTLLEPRWVALAIGAFLVISVPLRRLLERARYALGAPGVVIAGAGFGFLNGGMTGTGLLLVSILMAAGVQGASVIGTDAIISAVMGLAKIALFGSTARLDLELGAAGVLIGLCTAPGAFVARWLLTRIPMRVHTVVMEAVVLAGGVAFLWRAAQGSS